MNAKLRQSVVWSGEQTSNKVASTIHHFADERIDSFVLIFGNVYDQRRLADVNEQPRRCNTSPWSAEYSGKGIFFQVKGYMDSEEALLLVKVVVRVLGRG